MNHIRIMFAQFVSSDDDYIKMMTLHKGKNCKRLKAYTSSLLFLHDRVRLEKVVSWRIPQTKGFSRNHYYIIEWFLYIKNLNQGSCIFTTETAE